MVNLGDPCRMKLPGLTPGDLIPHKEMRDIHKDFYKGIYVPAGSDTAFSIRFRPTENADWGYEDRWIQLGSALDYTGQGAPPQDQTWNRFNLGLRRASEKGSCVQVFQDEGAVDGVKHYRYWGCWVVREWKETFVESQQRVVIRFILMNPAYRERAF
jgi:hypothetical protein